MRRTYKGKLIAWIEQGSEGIYSWVVEENNPPDKHGFKSYDDVHFIQPGDTLIIIDDTSGETLYDGIYDRVDAYRVDYDHLGNIISKNKMPCSFTFKYEYKEEIKERHISCWGLPKDIDAKTWFSYSDGGLHIFVNKKEVTLIVTTEVKEPSI